MTRKTENMKHCVLGGLIETSCAPDRRIGFAAKVSTLGGDNARAQLVFMQRPHAAHRLEVLQLVGRIDDHQTGDLGQEAAAVGPRQ